MVQTVYPKPAAAITALRHAQLLADLRKDHVRSGYQASAGAGLTLNVAPGVAYIQGVRIEDDASQSVTLTDNATNHVYLQANKDAQGRIVSASIVANTTGAQPADSLKLAEAVTSGGAISSVIDARPLSAIEIPLNRVKLPAPAASDYVTPSISDPFLDFEKWSRVGTDFTHDAAFNRLNFDTARDTADERAVFNPSFALGETEWKAEFTIHIESLTNTGRVVVGLYDATGNPNGFAGDALEAIFEADGAATPAPRALLGKVKGGARTLSAAIALAAGTTYYCTLRRRSALEAELAVYADEARTTHVAGSPVSLTIDETLTLGAAARLQIANFNDNVGGVIRGWLDDVAVYYAEASSAPLKIGNETFEGAAAGTLPKSGPRPWERHVSGSTPASYAITEVSAAYASEGAQSLRCRAYSHSSYGWSQTATAGVYGLQPFTAFSFWSLVTNAYAPDYWKDSIAGVVVEFERDDGTVVAIYYRTYNGYTGRDETASYYSKKAAAWRTADAKVNLDFATGTTGLGAWNQATRNLQTDYESFFTDLPWSSVVRLSVVNHASAHSHTGYSGHVQDVSHYIDVVENVVQAKHPATNAVDDDAATFWESASEVNPWLRVDTGALRILGGCRIYWLPWGRPAHYKIQVSADGSTWVDVFVGSVQPAADAWTEYSWSAVYARYIRVVAQETLAMAIAEFDYYSRLADRVASEHGHGSGVEPHLRVVHSAGHPRMELGETLRARRLKAKAAAKSGNILEYLEALEEELEFLRRATA